MKRNFVSILCLQAVLIAVVLFTGCQDTYTTSAKVYMQQNNPDKAIEQCLLAVEQIPNNFEAYFVLGQAYGVKGMYREMSEAFNKSLSINPMHAPEIQFNRKKYYSEAINTGVVKYREKNYEQATKSFEDATVIQPDTIMAYKNLLSMYLFLERDSDAVTTYRKTAKIDQNNLELRTIMGIDYYYKKKQYEQAIATLIPVTQKAPHASKVYKDAVKHIGICYSLLNQYDKAIQFYEDALKETPTDNDLIFNLGFAYKFRNDFAKSNEYFMKVLAANPDDVDANVQVGDNLFRDKKFTEALPYFEKVTQLQPENPDGWEGLGRTYTFMGNKAKAEEMLKKTEMLRKAKTQ
jgi:protein O-GlcNAc transferase